MSEHKMIQLTTDKCRTRARVLNADTRTRTRKENDSDSALARASTFRHVRTVNDRKFHVLMKKDAFNFSLILFVRSQHRFWIKSNN